LTPISQMMGVLIFTNDGCPDLYISRGICAAPEGLHTHTRELGAGALETECSSFRPDSDGAKVPRYDEKVEHT
jgi:hypothetical protein